MMMAPSVEANAVDCAVTAAPSRKQVEGIPALANGLQRATCARDVLKSRELSRKTVRRSVPSLKSKSPGTEASVVPSRQGISEDGGVSSMGCEHMAGIEAPVTPAAVPFPSWWDSSVGTVLACAILISIRMGRKSSEAERLDWRSMEARYMKAMGTNRELVQLRKEYSKQEARRKAEAAAKRVLVAQKKAEEASIERKERERIYKEQQEREAEKLRRKQELQRKEFEEKELVMQEELTKRAEVERRVIQEMEMKRKEEEEKRRLQEELRLKLEQEEREKAEQEERRIRQEQEKKLKEEKAKLEQLKTRFAVRAEGFASVWRAPPGTLTMGPLKEAAKVQMELSMSTVLAPEPQAIVINYASIEDAQKGCTELAGNVARNLFNKHKSAIRLQSMASSGPLEYMDDLEVEHWMRHASLRTASIAQKKMAKALESYAKGSEKDARQTFEARTEWGVLPEGNEKRTDGLLETAASNLKEKGGMQTATDVLREMMNDEEIIFHKGLNDGVLVYESQVCTLAHFTDRTLETRDSEIVELAASIVQGLLKEITKEAPKDSLLSISKSISCALGVEHPVSAYFTVIAEANMSAATRATIRERERVMEARLAAQVLEEEWPDREEIITARAKERDDSTPIPERVWALRNVARTLSLSTSSESAMNQAKGLLTKAVQLQEQYLGEAKHPGMLPALTDLTNVLLKMPATRKEAADQMLMILEILKELAERYQRQVDMPSAVICMESGVLEGEKVLGERHPMVKSMNRAVDNWSSALEPDEMDMVASCRKSGGGLQRVVKAFIPELGAYKTAGKMDRIEAWSTNERLEPL